MTWTEVPAPDGRRCWVGAWNDEGCLVLEHEPEWYKPWAVTVTGDGTQSVAESARAALDKIGCDLPAPEVEVDDHAACLAELDAEPDTVPAPEPPRFAVGDWVHTKVGQASFVMEVFPDSYYDLGVIDSMGFNRLKSSYCEATTRPDARWAIALDPKPGDVVTDDRGRRWAAGLLHGLWIAGYGAYVQGRNIFPCWSVHGDYPVATLPDTLGGLDRLNAASDVIDRRLDALPVGVEVTPEWRERCEAQRQERSERVGPGPDTVPARYDAPNIPWDRVGPGWSVLCGTATDPANACLVVEGFAPDDCVRIAASWMPWAPRSLVTAAFPPDGFDTEPRTSAGGAEDSERDGRPVMAWETRRFSVGEHLAGWEPIAATQNRWGAVGVICRRAVEVCGE